MENVEESSHANSESLDMITGYFNIGNILLQPESIQDIVKNPVSTIWLAS